MTASQPRLALVFPGQGSQSVGMAAQLLQESAAARALFQETDDLLGLPLTSIIQEGPDELLNDTAITQPAILAVSVALWREIEGRLGEKPPAACVAGHSLGEYTALAVAGALTYADAIRLVRQRGQAMAAAGQEAPGGMGVILGLADEEVQAIVHTVNADGAGVWIANLNCPGQVVISGRQRLLASALKLAEQRGAKRAMPLALSVASHTPLMKEATQALAEALEGVALRTPWAPLICNAWARSISSPAEIKQALLEQLTHPVQWTRSVEQMASMGVHTALEVGPKAVLSGLIRRIVPSIRRLSVTDMESARALPTEELLPWAT